MPADRDEKTEPATPRRRHEARQGGQVARSQDIPAAVLLLFGFLALAIFGAPLWHTLVAIIRTALTPDAPADLDRAFPFAMAAFVEVLKRLAPILVILFLAILLSMLAQVGLLFTIKPLIPTLSKINPLKGLQRLFSIRSVMVAMINFGKLLVVGLVAYLTLSNSAAAIIYASTFAFRDVFLLGWDLLFTLSMRMAAVLLIMSLFDYAWQRYKHERDMRMTKQEVKDEFRSMDGDPQIKRRRRQVQLQIAMQRLQTDVPKADVVVTNPTHVAVAIAYDNETMMAPKVVAKGADEVALRIRQIAARNSIPIVERKALARGIFEAVEVGEFIPERFYRAIAEILAYVYELTGRVGSRRTTQSVGVG